MLDSAYRFVTIDEVAKRRCINRFTAYHWLKTAPERLPRVTRIHGRVLFLESDVRAFFEDFEAEAGTAATVAPKRGAPTKAERIARAAAVADPAASPKRKRGRPRKEEVAAAVAAIGSRS